MNKALMNRVNTRFEELVPLEGKADTLAGEIVRAISRIGYRFYNDGDQVGVGYTVLFLGRPFLPKTFLEFI